MCSVLSLQKYGPVLQPNPVSSWGAKPTITKAFRSSSSLRLRSLAFQPLLYAVSFGGIVEQTKKLSSLVWAHTKPLCWIVKQALCIFEASQNKDLPKHDNKRELRFFHMCVTLLVLCIAEGRGSLPAVSAWSVTAQHFLEEYLCLGVRRGIRFSRRYGGRFRFSLMLGSWELKSSQHINDVWRSTLSWGFSETSCSPAVMEESSVSPWC